jgi:hypothetical protein
MVKMTIVGPTDAVSDCYSIILGNKRKIDNKDLMNGPCRELREKHNLQEHQTKEIHKSSKIQHSEPPFLFFS